MPRDDSRDEYVAAAVELLSDGRWHDYEQVLTALVLKVPPGQAKREAEHARAYLARRRAAARGEQLEAAPPRTRSVDDNALWRSGARTIIRRSLYRAEFEVGITTGSEGTKRIRLSRLGRAIARAATHSKGTGAVSP